MKKSIVLIPLPLLIKKNVRSFVCSLSVSLCRSLCVCLSVSLSLCVSVVCYFCSFVFVCKILYIVFFLQVGDDKEKRLHIHRAVKAAFPTLETKTEEKEGQKVITAMLKGKGKFSASSLGFTPVKDMILLHICCWVVVLVFWWVGGKTE